MDLPTEWAGVDEPHRPDLADDLVCAAGGGLGGFPDAYSVMNNWGANHGAVCYGHGGRSVALASTWRILDMHNVPEEQVFRPSAWARFGALDLQGADYRACAAYGPLYGRR